MVALRYPPIVAAWAGPVRAALRRRSLLVLVVLLASAVVALGTVRPVAADRLMPVAAPQLAPGAELSGQLGDAVVDDHPLRVEGSSRSYRAVLPHRPVGRLPLLVMLHGRAETMAQAMATSGFLPLARQGSAVLIFPVGVAGSWNATLGCCGTAGALGLPDISFVAAAVADAAARLPVDPARVYLVGYSNGGKLAYSEVCAHPRLFAALATYGSVPLAPCAAGTPPVSYLLAAGSADPVLPFRGRPAGRPPLPAVPRALEWLRGQDGCAAAAATSPVGRVEVTRWAGCREGAEVVSVVYPGRTHAWPTAGSVGQAAAASTVMWTFLSHHARGRAPAPGTAR